MHLSCPLRPFSIFDVSVASKPPDDVAFSVELWNDTYQEPTVLSVISPDTSFQFARFGSIQQGPPLGETGTGVYANQAMLDHTGLTMQDVLTSDFRARIYHPEDLERALKDREGGLARGLPFEIEQRVLRKPGPAHGAIARRNRRFPRTWMSVRCRPGDSSYQSRLDFSGG